MRRWLPLAVGGATGAVAAVFAVGVFVGHWFGVGEEPWSRVTLPMTEGEARVGVLAQFPQWVEAQEAVDRAQQALEEAEAALASAGSAAMPNPGQMPEAWQGWWCLLRGRSGMLSHRGDLPSGLDSAPRSVSLSDWTEWALTYETEFRTLCSAVMADQAPTLSEVDQAALLSSAARTQSAGLAAVRVAREELAQAESARAEAVEEYRKMLDAAVTRVLWDARLTRGAGSEEAIRAALGDAEEVYCDRAPEAVVDAAASLGLLPEYPSDDLVTYWVVTRPDEYIRACKAAYALR